MHFIKESILSVNIYTYLRSSLYESIVQSFPDFPINSESILLLFKSPSPDVDLNTPVARKIASSKKISADTVAHRIMSTFAWDERFVITDQQLKFTIADGFISFRLSNFYLFEVLKNAASSNIDRDFTTYSNLSSDTYKLLQKLNPLLKHAQRSVPLDTVLETTQFDLLKTADERKLIRLIAVSKADTIYSADAAVYFIRQLTPLLARNLLSTPVFSPDINLTVARVLLLKAAYIQLIELLHRSAMGKGFIY